MSKMTDEMSKMTDEMIKMTDETNYYYHITLLAPTLNREPGKHHYVSTDSYDIIRSDIAEACAQLSIERTQKAPHGYKCSYFKDQDLMNFDIEIYEKDKKHVIEFYQLNGDRFAFAELLDRFQQQLKCFITGAHSFHVNDGVDVSNLEQAIEFIKELVFNSAPLLQIEGIQYLAACARDIAKFDGAKLDDTKLDDTKLDGAKLDGAKFDDAKQTFMTLIQDMINKILSYNDHYLYVVSALAEIAPLGLTEDQNVKAKQMLLMDTPGYHERRERLRLALYLNLTEQEKAQFEIEIDGDKMADNYITELFK